MKKIIYLFLFISINSFCQSKFKLIATIEIEADFFTTDNQSNLYVVKANELSKFDKTGKLVYKYSNKNLGNIDFVDASNMLKLLVFYKNFSQVVFLDNTLSLTGSPVGLDKDGFRQAQLVCSSHNNGIWIYDQQNFELLRLNQALEKIQQTGNLSLLLSIDLRPNFLVEYNNKLYLNKPASGILMFDIYGTYYKTIPIKNAPFFQPIGDVVYFIANKKVKTYNIKTAEEMEFELPLNDFKNFRLEMDALFLQTEKSIFVYTSQ